MTRRALSERRSVSHSPPKKPSEIFQQALNLSHDKQHFNDILLNIRRIADRHLDYSMLMSRQGEAYKHFTEDVLSTYPFFAQDAERLRQLRMYTMKHAGTKAHHMRQRQISGQERDGTGEGDPPVDRYRATVDDGTPERMGIQKKKKKKRAIPRLSPGPQGKEGEVEGRVVGKAGTQAPPSLASGMLSEKPASLRWFHANSSDSSLEQSDQSSSSLAVSSSYDSPSSSNNSPQGSYPESSSPINHTQQSTQPEPPRPGQQQQASLTQLDSSLSPFASLLPGSHDIFAFLMSLQPPLPDLLIHFAELGFKDASYIHGVAGWSVEDQLAYLKPLGPTGEGRFTSLDIATLMIGFRRMRDGT